MARLSAWFVAALLAMPILATAPAAARDLTPAPDPGMMDDRGATPEQRKCLQEFSDYRSRVEKRAAAVAAESKKRLTRERMCELVDDYSAVEFEWLKFAEINMTRCGIALQTIEQIKSAHSNTLGTKKKLCASDAPRTGPHWCHGCARSSDAADVLAQRSVACASWSGWRASPRLFCGRA
jgi:hypothetical protein